MSRKILIGCGAALALGVVLVVVLFVGVIIGSSGSKQGSSPPDSSGAVSSSAEVIQAFEEAGLEVGQPYPVDEDPNWTSNMVPKTYEEGTHFDATEDQGGQVLVFENRRDLEVMKKYWENFNEKGGFLYSHVYERDNALLHINGKLPKSRADEYNEIFQAV